MAQHSSCWAKARVEEAAVKREAVEAAVEAGKSENEFSVIDSFVIPNVD